MTLNIEANKGAALAHDVTSDIELKNNGWEEGVWLHDTECVRVSVYMCVRVCAEMRQHYRATQAVT